MHPDEAVGKIRRALIDLNVESISLLGSGTDSVAFLVNDNWVFRFPLVEGAIATLRKEILLLPRLTKALSSETPQFEYIG